MTTTDQHHLSVLVRGQDTLLARAHAHGVVTAADVQLAATVARLYQAGGDDVFVLTTALALASARAGSTCVDLRFATDRFVGDVLAGSDFEGDDLVRAAAELRDALAWPDPHGWAAALRAQAAVGDEGSEPNTVPLRLVGTLVYLERYWMAEEVIAEVVAQRQAATPPVVDEERLRVALDSLYPGNEREELQRRAVEVAVRSWTSVVAGGPGTGKTRTVARVLAALQAQLDRPLRIALAAPSGKAASRLTEAIAEARVGTLPKVPDTPPGRTLHSLLGAMGRSGTFRRDASSPLTEDVVVVDEVSMVDLQLFARLLVALPATTRLVLVGDPQQLKSVNAGSVLADLAESGLSIGGGDARSAVTELTVGWRNDTDIHDLAQAIREADVETALGLLARGSEQVHLLEQPLDRTTTWRDLGALGDEVAEQWTGLIDAAEAGDAATALAQLNRHRVLCGHREGLYGVSAWSAHTLQLIRERRPGFGRGTEFHAGRPLILTANDHALGLTNGDTGVIVMADGLARAAIGTAEHHRLLGPALLRALESMYAMTVHKAQGSQFDHVTVVLPPLGSPLLTRDLVYTAITRARRRVTLLGGPEQLAAAIANESRRASGLASHWRAEH